jgi:hypothetical protein
MQNEGLFRDPTGVGILHKTSKFWSRGPYRDTTQLLEAAAASLFLLLFLHGGENQLLCSFPLPPPAAPLLSSQHFFPKSSSNPSQQAKATNPSRWSKPARRAPLSLLSPNLQSKSAAAPPCLSLKFSTRINAKLQPYPSSPQTYLRECANGKRHTKATPWATSSSPRNFFYLSVKSQLLKELVVKPEPQAATFIGLTFYLFNKCLNIDSSPVSEFSSP